MIHQWSGLFYGEHERKLPPHALYERIHQSDQDREISNLHPFSSTSLQFHFYIYVNSASLSLVGVVKKTLSIPNFENFAFYHIDGGEMYFWLFF